MKILVTGAQGFVGSKLAGYLQAGGHKVITTGRHPQPSGGFFSTFIQGDLVDPGFSHQICEGVDTVVHCAGKTGVWGSFSEYEASNVVATKNLLQACKAKKQEQRFIFLSTPSIYFEYRDKRNLKEDQVPKELIGPYSKTKFQAEQLVLNANNARLKTIALRPRGVIGAGEPHYLPRIIKAYEKNRLHKLGRRNPLMSFTHIENLSALVRSCLVSEDQIWGEAYNVCDAQPVAFWDLVDKLLKGVGYVPNVASIPYPLAMGAAKACQFMGAFLRTSEPDLLPIKVGMAAYSLTLNIDKAIKKLRYQPTHTTDEAVAEFCHHYLINR